MNYIKAITNTVSKSFEFNGRSSVQEYWRATTFYFLLAIIGNLVFSILGENSPINANVIGGLSEIYQFIILVPFFGLVVRRLHDTNKSGWWIWISLTVVGIIPLIYWTLKKSDESNNSYGEVPEDANVGNFHRNIGVTVNILMLLVMVIVGYSSFNSFAEWQKEEVGDVGSVSQTIYRLFPVKNTKGAIFKLTFMCTKEKEMGLVISTISTKNDIELPAPIVDSSKSIKISYDQKGDEVLENKSLKFVVLKDVSNLAFADASQRDLLKLIENEFIVSVQTIDEMWTAKINATDSQVIKFINECTK